MKRIISVAVVVAAMVATAASAATASDGATVTNGTECTTSGQATFCVTARTVTATTATPSGNLSYLVNGTVEHTLTRPDGYRSTWTASIHEHVLAKDGEPVTVSDRVEALSDVVWGDVAFSCVASYAVQLANGEIRIDRAQIECTPS